MGLGVGCAFPVVDDEAGPVVGLGVGCAVPVVDDRGPVVGLGVGCSVSVMHVESCGKQAAVLRNSMSTSKVSEVPLASVTVYVILVTETPKLGVRTHSKSPKLTQDTLQFSA